MGCASEKEVIAYGRDSGGDSLYHRFLVGDYRTSKKVPEKNEIRTSGN